MAPNIPAMYEAHFGIPMAGAILNCINIRLDARTIAFQLRHSGSKAILVDQEFFTLVDDALKILKQNLGPLFQPPLLVVLEDRYCPKDSLDVALSKGACGYEEFLQLLKV